MKKATTIAFQAFIILIGLSALLFLLGAPHFEGRNTHATVFEVYFNDPFLAYVYTASLVFFFALHQALKLVGYREKDKLRSPETVKSVRKIKCCALLLIACILAAEAYIITTMYGKDDITGGVAMGLYMMFPLGIAATVAGALERQLSQITSIS